MVQNLQPRRHKGSRPRDIFEEHGNGLHPSIDCVFLGTCVGRAMRRPCTNALCGHAPRVSERHPIARRVGNGLGIYLAGCTRSHGVLAG